MASTNKRRKVVCSEGRQIIANVYHFLKEEYEFTELHREPNCDISHLRNITRRTAEATGVSERTVKTILREERAIASKSLNEVSRKYFRCEGGKSNIEYVGIDEDPYTYENQLEDMSSPESMNIPDFEVNKELNVYSDVPLETTTSEKDCIMLKGETKENETKNMADANVKIELELESDVPLETTQAEQDCILPKSEIQEGDLNLMVNYLASSETKNMADVMVKKQLDLVSDVPLETTEQECIVEKTEIKEEEFELDPEYDEELRSLRLRTQPGSAERGEQLDVQSQVKEEEFEREKHFFRNEEYPGLASGSDPESDLFSDNGSSDYYKPSSEEELSEGNTSDGSICDERYQRDTNFMPQNTKQHDLNQNQTPFMLKYTTEHSPHHLQAYTKPKKYLTPQTAPEHESHQRQTKIMLQTNAEQDPRQPQTYIMPQNNTENELRQPQTCIMPQNTTELSSLQQQVKVISQTMEGHQSQAKDCNNSVEKGRKRDFCFYCKTHVLNFARHIIRQHYLEVDVQKILAIPKKRRTRRNLITDLKKKGNYISNMVRCERPMRKEKRVDQNDYLPCSNCLGFYARKQLWKHKKKCDPELKGSQAEAQNFMCRNSSHIPSKSLQKVFSRMRADKISFVVKQDPTICLFGENYLKVHRAEHFTNVTSRKMRELAKLLIEVQKIKPEIKSFFDALNPQNYDSLVAASKIVAKYDETTDHYCSPTYAMNISTSIKQCCNIAVMKILKTETCIKSAELQADLRTLIQLIESNWKFDISSNSADDLNLKKWNKVTIVPLASDLKLLKDHLCAIAQKSAAQLKEDENYQNTVIAYNELVETVFCRALLTNRRRPGELQRLMLSTYVENEHNTEYKYEEFDSTLTATERILVQRFKRIVIRGKRSRGVPVLFSTDVQHDLDLLISLRSKYIDINNKFLFAKPSSMTYLCGYKVLQKHVKLCGAKNPEAISSTKLREHLATLTQLFNMSENDIKQLLNFMGHTTGVQRRNYRLPDDIFQTAKISKLLILMEDGKADSFKGKSLDQINLNMEEELEGEGLEREDVINFAESRNTLQELESGMATDMSATTAQNVATPFSDNATSVCEPLANISNITSRSTKKKRVLVPWTSQQKNIVKNHFKRHIKSKKPPKRYECEELKAFHPELLKNKDWLKIKVFIQNCYSKH